MLLPHFEIVVNNKKTSFNKIYREFDDKETYSITSVNQNITTTDTKTIRNVTRTSYHENLCLFKCRSGRTLECSIDQIIPVMRILPGGPSLVLVQAQAVTSGDSFYVVSDGDINIDLVQFVGQDDFGGSLYTIEVIPTGEDIVDDFFINANSGIVVKS